MCYCVWTLDLQLISELNMLILMVRTSDRSLCEAASVLQDAGEAALD